MKYTNGIRCYINGQYVKEKDMVIKIKIKKYILNIKVFFMFIQPKRFEKKSYSKKMKYWLTFHKPFGFGKAFQYIYCPKCGNNNMRDNGEGFFRCRGKCGTQFIILERDETLLK